MLSNIRVILLFFLIYLLYLGFMFDLVVKLYIPQYCNSSNIGSIDMYIVCVNDKIHNCVLIFWLCVPRLSISHSNF